MYDCHNLEEKILRTREDTATLFFFFYIVSFLIISSTNLIWTPTQIMIVTHTISDPSYHFLNT